MKRIVIVTKPSLQSLEIVEKIALFHKFGINYMRSNNGMGNYSTAIIEWPDGQLENVAVENIKFLMPSKKIKAP